MSFLLKVRFATPKKGEAELFLMKSIEDNDGIDHIFYDQKSTVHDHLVSDASDSLLI